MPEKLKRLYAADNDSRGGTFIHDGVGRLHQDDYKPEDWSALVAEIEAEAAEQRAAIAAAAAKPKGDA